MQLEALGVAGGGVVLDLDLRRDVNAVIVPSISAALPSPTCGAPVSICSATQAPATCVVCSRALTSTPLARSAGTWGTFAYEIVDTATQAPLFVGVEADPSASS